MCIKIEFTRSCRGLNEGGEVGMCMLCVRVCYVYNRVEGGVIFFLFFRNQKTEVKKKFTQLEIERVSFCTFKKSTREFAVSIAD